MIEQFLELYTQKALLLKKIQEINPKKIKGEMVFLVSDIEWDEKKYKNTRSNLKAQKVTAETVLKSLKKVEKSKYFLKNKDDLKILFIEDMNELIDPEKYLSYYEAIEYINTRIIKK